MGCRALNETEVKNVLETMTNLRDKALFVLGIKTGYRISELLSLTLDGVLNPDGTIRDFVTVARKSMKGKSKSRTIAIHNEAKLALTTYLQTRDLTKRDLPLFISRQFDKTGRAKAITRVQAHQVLSKAFEMVGICDRTGTHMMRKSFAKNIYKRVGGDLLKVKAALGHKQLDSTVSYLDTDMDDVNAAVLAG